MRQGGQAQLKVNSTGARLSAHLMDRVKRKYNNQSLLTVRKEVMNMIYYWLNRRSQRRSYNRYQFRQIFELYLLPWPKVVWILWSNQLKFDLA